MSIYVKHFLHHIYRFRYLFSSIAYFALTFFLTIQPVFSQSLSTDCPLPIPDSWKSHFPFDLVYPIGNMQAPATTCPTLVFFGTPREVCSVLTVTQVAKGCFLLKVVIQSLINL